MSEVLAPEELDSGGQPGDLGIYDLLAPDRETFWLRVVRSPLPGACWLWHGDIKDTGYGFCKVKLSDGTRSWWTTRGAHRLAYQFERGPIPAALELDHLCFNRTCVNPDHLEPVTHLTNMQRAREFQPPKHYPKCVNGHVRSPENLRPGRRDCAICHRERAYRAYQAKRAAQQQDAD